MAQYSNLKAYIEEKIYENGTQAITGDILQDVLKVMTDDLGEFYQMGGVASPSTDPGTPDAKVIYFATEAGTYTNFGGITLEAGEVALLIFETSWTKETLNVLSAANGGVKAANLADGAVTTEKIAGGAVETAKIANNAVTSGKVADGAIGTAKIADGAIAADKIAANAVETAKIKNGAVTEGKINDGAVTAGKVAANAVTTAKIADDAVTTAKLNDGAVTEDKIATDAVTSGKVKDGAIGTAKIAAGAVTHAKIGAGAVEESNIKDGAVTSDKIADGAVGSDQLAEGAFSAENLADGSVTTDKLADEAVTAEKIADGAVTANKFANGSVTTIKLGSGAVTTEKIGDGMVTRQKLADSSVSTSKIIDGAVTTDKVADGAITDAKLENPVSVSQNTITGGDELNMGDSTKPIVGVQVNQKKNTDFAIHGLIYANGTITDADASPYRRTNIITLLPNEVIMVYSSIQSASGSHLNIYADSACTELIQSFAGIEDDTNVYRKTYVNNTGSTVYAIMCGDSRNGFDKTFGLFGDSLYYKDLLSINAQAIQSVHNELLQVDNELLQVENSESFSIDTVFVNPGLVNSNGVIVSTPASAYRMTAPILLRTGKKITVRAYGSSELNPIAVFGDNLLTKFQRVINGIVPEQGEDYGFGIFSYENKSGFDMYIICTTHNSKQNECWYKIDDAQQTNDDVILDIADIYKEKGVCLWTTKTYTHNNASPYVTRFIPVKENQLVYMYNGSYPSTFEVFACDASKQYVESPINLRGSEHNDELIKHYITIRIPQGIDYIGITNREDELTNPQLKVYQSNLYVNAKVRPIIKDYDLSPNKGHIAFVVDGAYNADADLKALFDQKGIKAGWAPLYPVYYPGYYGMDMHMDWYMQWQNEGHEILTHSGPSVVWNDIAYDVPSDPTEQAAFAKMRIEQFRNIGFITRGFVQLGSQKFATEEARKPIYNSYEYGFTRATNEITEPDQGAVMMPTDKPWNLGRSTLEVITLAQMKSLIDECASKKGFLCIYLHSWRIGNAQYPNQTWATMAEMMDYALSKCVVDIPYNCIKALYANHIE